MTARSKMVVALAALALAAAADEAPKATRTVLQKHDLHVQGVEGVMALVSLPPGAREGRHTHAADAMVYVIDGALTLDLEGQPQTTYQQGQSFFIPAGKIHEGVNKGQAPAKLVASFFADKGKPLTTQVETAAK